MRFAVFTLIVAGATVLSTTTGEAADQAKPYDPRAAFAESDTNKDGSIDLAEFHARLVEVFYNADTNKDGVLDIDEYKRLPLSGDFEEADADHNGSLTLHEFIRIRYREFEAADKNDDGELSVDEVVAAYEGRPQ
jgi:Ca2+-binding EF-hand superfamily protein